jgi:hypothetical protein
MSASIIKASELNVSELTFSDVKTDKYNKKMVFVNRPNGQKVLIQTPKMFNVFGVKRWHTQDTDSKDDSFAVELSFSGKDTNPELEKFHKVLSDLDEVVREKIFENSSSWLNKSKISKDSIKETVYLPVLRVSTDKNGNTLEYPDRFKVKFDKDSSTGKFISNKKTNNQIMVFDENKSPIDIDADNIENVMGKGTYLTSVVELVYITMAPKVSLKFKFVQGKLVRNSNEINGYAMLEDENEVNESLNNLTLNLPKDLDTASAEQEFVDDQELQESVEEENDEEEDADEEEEMPTVKVMEPVKKTRTKKTA